VPGNVRSVERAAAIMTLLASAGRPLELVEIAERVGLHKTTAHGLLATLRSVGWVEQDRPHSGYRAAWRLQGLARVVDSADLRSLATPWMDWLAAVTGLEVLLCRQQDARAEIIQHVYRPDNSPQRLRVGDGLPLHATAAGKVLLAHPPGGIETALPEPPEGFTRFTLRDRTDLRAEISRVRSEGHAVESGEHYPDVHSVAVSVVDPIGEPVAALSVVGPRDEVLEHGHAAPAVIRALVRAAGSVSRAIASPP
jgi:DNA-binding IclR family transcriptional regulator